MFRPLTLLILAATATALDRPGRERLVWHAAGVDDPVMSREADRPFNPASITKLATTLWALVRLGPEHRFETRFVLSGGLDRDTGVLDGDLLVFGGGDPDFHVENAWIVAEELNRLGLREVRGALRVNAGFWLGWEGGSGGRIEDPARRERTMAQRLRDALDPARQSAATRGTLDAFLERSGRSGKPGVVVRGGIGRHDATLAEAVRLTHRSNRLRTILKRFNSFSNNDIERLEFTLGDAGRLAAFLSERWQVPAHDIRFATLSGLGTNRLTARLVVRLLEDLRATCRRSGLDVDDLLPRVGCDPGTLRHFPGFAGDRGDAPIVAKTGTLTTTDGGVAVLAGYAATERGDVSFCVAAPGSGSRLAQARADQQRWVLDWLETMHPADAGACGAGVVHSDRDVLVVAE